MRNNSDPKPAVDSTFIHTSYNNITPSIPTTDGYRLNPAHYQEWLHSCVHKELLQANEIFSLDGDEGVMLL